MTGYSSSTISVLAVDNQGNITVPTNSDLSLGSGLLLNAVSIDQAGQNLFVADETSGIIPVSISVNGASVTLTQGVTLASPTTGCAYVVTNPAQGSSNIFTADNASVSALDFTSGGVLSLDNSISADNFGFLAGGGNPGGIAIDSQGQNLYIASNMDYGCWQFSLSGATLTDTGNMAYSDSTNNGPMCCAVDQGSNNLVVGNDDGSIEVYPLSGGLSSYSNTGAGIQGSTVTGACVNALAFDPTGSYIVTANGQSNDASLFTYDGTQGAANFVTTATGLTNPSSVIFDPDQSTPVVFIANTGAQQSSIAAFNYNPNGFTPLNNGTPFPTSANVAGPMGMVIQ